MGDGVGLFVRDGFGEGARLGVGESVAEDVTDDVADAVRRAAGDTIGLGVRPAAGEATEVLSTGVELADVRSSAVGELTADVPDPDEQAASRSTRATAGVRTRQPCHGPLDCTAMGIPNGPKTGYDEGRASREDPACRRTGKC